MVEACPHNVICGHFCKLSITLRALKGHYPYKLTIKKGCEFENRHFAYSIYNIFLSMAQPKTNLPLEWENLFDLR